jgi:hypothetical protein
MSSTDLAARSKVRWWGRKTSQVKKVQRVQMGISGKPEKRIVRRKTGKN